MSRAEPLDQWLTDRGLSSPEEAEGAEDLLLKCLDGIDEGLNGAPDKWETGKTSGENELDAVTPAARLLSVFHYLLPNTGAASTSSSASTARM